MQDSRAHFLPPCAQPCTPLSPGVSSVRPSACLRALRKQAEASRPGEANKDHAGPPAILVRLPEVVTVQKGSALVPDCDRWHQRGICVLGVELNATYTLQLNGLFSCLRKNPAEPSGASADLSPSQSALSPWPALLLGHSLGPASPCAWEEGR